MIATTDSNSKVLILRHPSVRIFLLFLDHVHDKRNVEFRIFNSFLFILILAGPLLITVFIVKAERSTLVLFKI